MEVLLKHEPFQIRFRGWSLKRSTDKSLRFFTTGNSDVKYVCEDFWFYIIKFSVFL